MAELVDLVTLRPIRRKDGTMAVRMADGTLLEIVRVKLVCGERPDGTWIGEGHPMYLWRMGFVIALLNAGYAVTSAENHVLAVAKAADFPAGVVPLSEERLLAEAINARVALDVEMSGFGAMRPGAGRGRPVEVLAAGLAVLPRVVVRDAAPAQLRSGLIGRA